MLHIFFQRNLLKLKTSLAFKLLEQTHHLLNKVLHQLIGRTVVLIYFNSIKGEFRQTTLALASLKITSQRFPGTFVFFNLSLS